MKESALRSRTRSTEHRAHETTWITLYSLHNYLLLMFFVNTICVHAIITIPKSWSFSGCIYIYHRLMNCFQFETEWNKFFVPLSLKGSVHSCCQVYTISSGSLSEITGSIHNRVKHKRLLGTIPLSGLPGLEFACPLIGLADKKLARDTRLKLGGEL